MGSEEVNAFLTHLAVKGQVSVSSRNQALSALLFLYRELLEREGVATTPGPDFDTARGHRYLRISFAGTQDDCRATLDGLGRFLKR